MTPRRTTQLPADDTALLRPFAPDACYATLGAAPWMSSDEIHWRFADRFRQARRDPQAPYTQEQLNAARARFHEPGPSVERRFWTFPLALDATVMDLSAEAAPPPDEAAVRAALLEAIARWD